MVRLRDVTKDDYSLNLDVNEDQHKFVADYKKILDYAFDGRDKERTYAYIICDEDVPVGVIEYSDQFEIKAYNLCYLFIDQRFQREGEENRGTGRQRGQNSGYFGNLCHNPCSGGHMGHKNRKNKRPLFTFRRIAFVIKSNGLRQGIRG